MKTDIIVAEAYEDCMGEFIVIETRDGTVSEDDEVAAVEAAGYTVIGEDEGGLYASYDADDAPQAVGAQDGHAGVAITVEPRS